MHSGDVHGRKPASELILRSAFLVLTALIAGFVFSSDTYAQTHNEQNEQTDLPSLAEVKSAGALKSDYRKRSKEQASAKFSGPPVANLATFKETIQPLLRDACYQCHGAEQQEGDFRVDALNPDLVHGDDRSWWVEVFDVLSKGEMPPKDEVELAAAGRSQIIEWLSQELQVASQVARSEQGHSSFRRMTRYEYNYALQDLLGLPYDFVDDLPPETVSEDGFLNSSEMLQMSAMQFEQYRQIARSALMKATVSGDQPKPVYFAVTMDFGLEKARKGLEQDLEKIRKRFANKPEKLEAEIAKRKSGSQRGVHYRNSSDGISAPAKWRYSGARYAREPTWDKPKTPGVLPDVAVIPRGQKLVVDLGDHLPDSGTLRMRIRCGVDGEGAATLRTVFGHQASNNSRADERIGDDVVITASVDDPQFYNVDIPLSEVIRNPFRGIEELGKTPNPAEYVVLHNVAMGTNTLQIDYIEVTAPYFETWPPQTHRQIFVDRNDGEDEVAYVRRVLANFIPRAWRRPPTVRELDQKIALYEKLRPQCENAYDATVQVLADVLSSPKFLYLVRSETAGDMELATRLAMFLWSSVPDQTLLDLAESGELSQPKTLNEQTERMLHDPRARRFPKHFVRQWLGMQLMDHLQIEKELRDAMHEEPIALFGEMLKENHSVMDFLHSDYTMVNATLARHYAIPNVSGNEFRRVSLPANLRRGGLLTQAGLLAMNSDGKDSHPLKRGIWLLESLLNDPPPPPPPAVPEIDLSDPDILKLTLKERMEDHRNDPACMSCHQRIDPWGIAFENYDALGRWRNSIGKKSVDANSLLFNKQPLHGMDGLKRFLLENRQDQFARALTHKLAAYALGRPISFADRAELDEVTAQLRQRDDGLRTLIKLITASNLFRHSKRSD